MKKISMSLLNFGIRSNFPGSKQRAILMANVAAIGGALSLFTYAACFLLIDPVNLRPVIWINLAAVFFILTVLLLNDRQHFQTAAIWLILSASIPVFINLRLYLGYRTGAHFFFILFSLLPILIIQKRRSVLVPLLSGMQLVFFFLTYRYIPVNNLVSDIPGSVLITLENVTTLFVLIVIILMFYVNQRIIDAFEKDLNIKQSRLEAAMVEAKKFASVDSLTDILNRGHIEQRINEELLRGYRYGFPISLVMFDIDHFKNVNDEYGHDAGDLVLKKMAAAVKNSIRETDMLGRWGGEEFMILLPYTSEAIADVVAKKLCRILENTDHGEFGKITASFGVAQWDGLETFDRLYKRLDKALYSAKEQGRNRVVTDLLVTEIPQLEPKIYWKTDWESGHLELDRQHRRLIETLSAFLNQEESAKESDFLDLLYIDLAAHFEYEENLLVKIGYPNVDAHKIIHKKLLKWLKSLRSEHVEYGKYPQHAIHILEETIITHILEEDTKFFPLLH
jgi:diguanylate cyclase (GGDEF)-like protein/hemerythrin-like metal-binding protein